MREIGHLKRLYCLYCDKEINHVECIEGGKYDPDMFKLEYESGNFDSSGNRVMPLKQWIGESDNYETEYCDDLTTEEWMKMFDY